MSIPLSITGTSGCFSSRSSRSIGGGGGGCFSILPCTRWAGSPWTVPITSVAESRVTETVLGPPVSAAASEEAWKAKARAVPMKNEMTGRRGMCCSYR
jgi:hypothetical protein